ncbi:enoyl-CoA hydratase/isomerase [Xylaria bambusicola]|uniref:enoyl-CoA hydratase/isomerase n=1 Tax=Xylaria bambusicola TaxID=326684 RepID=UPI002007E3A6|nr:enoyl-CoA hydratase/isomerase [Xylaria bambusicola]KAI0528096.1 enoyl-CoA hydratase/isomerase [Xylaria bambusicola]
MSLPDFEGFDQWSLAVSQKDPSTGSNDVRVGIDRTEAVAVVQLSRPAKRNALTQAMMDHLISVLDQLDQDGNVRAVVLMGTKKGAFSAGVDISELTQLTTGEAHERRFLSDLNGAFERFSKPIIAAVEGLALGGGFEVALSCDIIYAAEDATFGLPEVSIGTIPGAGGTQRLVRALGKYKAMELILSRQTISGQELAQRGLVSRAFGANEDVVLEAKRLAARIAAYSRPVINMAKQAVLAAENNHLEAGMAIEKQLYYMTFSLDDFKEGTSAFLNKQPPEFKHH